MKQIIIPLMLLLFVGSLFAVESARSQFMGYVYYDLVAGNNTIALPMNQGYAQASEVGDAMGASTVGYFNKSTQLWQIIYNSPFDGWNSDFATSIGDPLSVSTDNAGTWPSRDIPAISSKSTK